MTGKRFVVIDQDSLKKALAEADAGDAVTVVEGAFEKPPKLKVVHGKWVVEQGAFAQPGWDLCYPATSYERWVEAGRPLVSGEEMRAMMSGVVSRENDLTTAFAAAMADVREGLSMKLTEAKQRRAEEDQTRARAEFRQAYADVMAEATAQIRELGRTTEQLEAAQRRAETDLMLEEFCSLYRDAVAGDAVAMRSLPEAAEKLLAFARTKALDGLINSFNENKSEPYEPISFGPIAPTDPDFYTW